MVAGQETLFSGITVRRHGQATKYHHVPVSRLPASGCDRYSKTGGENEVWRG